MKKLITALLSAAVLLVSGSAVLAAKDVLIPKISDWARPAVEAAQKDGTIPSTFGVTDYTQNISREKFCELAVAALLVAAVYLLCCFLRVEWVPAGQKGRQEPEES